MKRYILLLCVPLFVFGANYWTLSGLDKSNIYVESNVAYLKPSSVKKIKEKIATLFHKNGIQTDVQDAPTMILKLSEIEADESHYVYIKLALGEEVQTFRKSRDETFAYTYFIDDFIELDSDELDESILESVDALLDQFSEQFVDDKEE